jgi:hypothetical protein
MRSFLLTLLCLLFLPAMSNPAEAPAARYIRFYIYLGETKAFEGTWSDSGKENVDEVWNYLKDPSVRGFERTDEVGEHSKELDVDYAADSITIKSPGEIWINNGQFYRFQEITLNRQKFEGEIPAVPGEAFRRGFVGIE